jgi:DNA polymerase-1
MPTLYLIDASVFICRAYFSLPPTLVDRFGAPANALFGFAQFLAELLERRGPSHIAVAFDESLAGSFRRSIYPPYKANRPEAPPELVYQFRRCRELTAALGIAGFASASHEADDLIGALAAQQRRTGVSMVYVSADKDLAQLIQDQDRLWDAPRGRLLDAEGVEREFGVRPGQIVDLLGLAGDAVDNIPGVPGIGRKTAAALLNEREDMAGIYADLEAVAGLPLRGAKRVKRLLAEHAEQAWLSRRLATIDCAAPLGKGQDLAWAGADPQALAELGLSDWLTRRLTRLAPAWPLEA